MKVNVVDTKIPSTNRLVTKTQYDSVKQGLERKIEDVDKKIPNTSRLVKKIDFSIKTKDIENKLPSVTDLVTTVALKKKHQRD